MARRTKARKEEREQLKDYYNSREWIDKVDAMTDREVIDILDRLQNQERRAA